MRSALKHLGRTLNWTSPVGLLILIIIGLMLAALGANAIGFRFDPFDRTAKRAERAEAAAAAARSDAAARRFEVAGERDTAARVEVVVRQTALADRTIQTHALNARTAPDALTSLDPDRARRLYDVDQQLCAARPAICDGPDDPAPARDARTGDTALPTGRTPAG